MKHPTVLFLSSLHQGSRQGLTADKIWSPHCLVDFAPFIFLNQLLNHAYEPDILLCARRREIQWQENRVSLGELIIEWELEMGVFGEEGNLNEKGHPLCLFLTAKEGLGKVEIWSSCSEECARLNNMSGEAKGISGSFFPLLKIK